MLEYAYFDDDRSLRDRPARSDHSAGAAAVPLIRGAALIVVLLSSLGLWWVICLTISSLASARL
jgi:hypothetical protein